MLVHHRDAPFSCFTGRKRHQTGSWIKGAMSLKIMSQVWEHKHLDNPTEKLVLLSLADFANDEGECWPKIPTVAHKCSITEQACSNIIKRLAARGFLSLVRRRGRGNSNSFYLHVARGKEAGSTGIPNPEKGFTDGVLEQNPIQKRVFSTGKPNPENPFLNDAYKEEPSVHKPPIESSAEPSAESSEKSISVESDVAMAIRTVCKKRTLMLSSNDTKALVEVLRALPPDVSVDQVNEFGRKVNQVWKFRDRAPKIIEVLEHWGEVLDLPEPGEMPAGGRTQSSQASLVAQHEARLQERRARAAGDSNAAFSKEEP
jgi:hypothetical protein